MIDLSTLKTHGFVRVRDFDELSRFHVPFERLAPGCELETPLADLLRGGGVAGGIVIGPSGAGKSSVLSALLHAPDPMGDQPHFAPVRLSVAGVHKVEVLADPGQLAHRLVRDAVRRYLPGNAFAVADSAPRADVLGAIESRSAELDLKVGKANAAIQQATANYSIERTADEAVGVAEGILQALRDQELTPVLLLDDADGLLGAPESVVSRAEAQASVDGFFSIGLSTLLRQLSLPVLLAARPEYEDLEAFTEFRHQHANRVVHVPAPEAFDSDAVTRIVSANVTGVGITRAPGELFTNGALAALNDARPSLPVIRDVLEVCLQAVQQADDDGRPKVDEPDVIYGITQVAR